MDRHYPSAIVKHNRNTRKYGESIRGRGIRAYPAAFYRYEIQIDQRPVFLLFPAGYFDCGAFGPSFFVAAR